MQGAIENALTTIASRPVTLTGSGRTDSGVHACGQVVSFDLSWQHDTETLQRALNANLPDDIVLRKVAVAAPDFHPRYDARRRAYRYYLYNAPLRSPLRRLRSWYVSQPLSIERMNEAAASLIGVHDFATFGQPPQGESTVRELFHARWHRQDEMLLFEIEGNAFLYRMVRSLVGTLKVVGEGRWSVEAFVDAFRACDRSRAAATAPPEGLFLLSVTYDEELA